MENKGKKIWTILLTVYVTIVTAACALFAYLYFSGNGKVNVENLNAAEARILVTDVKNKTEATFTGVAGASMDEDNYTEEKLPETITGSTSSNLLKGISNILEDCIEILQKDASAGVWYHCTEETIDYIKYKIDENKVYIYLASPDEDVHQSYAQTYIITKTGEKTWTVRTYLYLFSTVTESSNYYPQMMTYKYDGTKIYYVETAVTPLHANTFTSSVKNVSEIALCAYYRCDLNSHKEIDRMTTPEKMALMTDSEKVELANTVLMYVSTYCSQYKTTDFADAQQI